MPQPRHPQPLRRPAGTLVLALLALALARPAAADAKAEIRNASGAAWSLVLVPNGMTTGGDLKVGQRTLKPWDVERIEAGATKQLVFSYTVSYAVRIRLVDSKGNWVEYRSDKGATERFDGEGNRWQPVVWNHPADAFANLPQSVVTDVDARGAAAKGNIRILKDTLEEGGEARAGGKAPFPHVATSSGLAQAAPCGLIYLFNRSGAAYKITSIGAPGAGIVQTGSLVFADLNGGQRQEFKPGQAVETFNLNPNQGVLVFAVSAKDKPCHRFFSLVDADGLSLPFEVTGNGKAGGASLQKANDPDGPIINRGIKATTPGSGVQNLEMDAFPGPVLTIIRNAFPPNDTSQTGTRKRR